MEWTPWLSVLIGVIAGGLTAGVAMLGIWGAAQYRLGRLEARMDGLETRMDGLATRIDRLERLHQEAKAENLRLHQEARAENLRLHEETRAEIRREIRFLLQVMREHTHADGSPATTNIPVPADSD